MSTVVAHAPTVCESGQSCSGPDDCVSSACRGEGECVDTCYAAFGLSCDEVGHEVHAGASDEESDFGRRIALDGDRFAATGAGAVFVYERVGGAWSLDAVISAPTGRAGRAFGSSLALRGDELVVGASGAGAEDPGAGRAYVFRRARAGEWTQHATLVPIGDLSAAFDFGFALALSAEWLAVSAPDRGTGSATSGRVHLFRRAGDAWVPDTVLTPRLENDANMQFGVSLSLEGDLLAIGAPGEAGSDFRIDGDELSTNASSSGAVFLFRFVEGEWEQEAYLKASNGYIGYRFGVRLSVDAGRVLVGSMRESSDLRGAVESTRLAGARSSVDESGAAYLFERGAMGWMHTFHFKAANRDESDWFSNDAVVLRGGYIVVSSVAEAGAGPLFSGDPSSNLLNRSGAVYVFRELPTVGWRQVIYLKAPVPAVNNEFGAALAFEDQTLLVGAPSAPSEETADVGVIHAFDLAAPLGDEVCDAFDNDGDGSIDETFAECEAACVDGLCE